MGGGPSAAAGREGGLNAAARKYLGSCRLGNGTFMKLPLRKIPLKLPFGKNPLGKYQT